MKAVPCGAHVLHQLDDGAHAVDVHAGVDLVEQCQPRLQQRQLQQLVAFAFAAREAVVHRAAEHRLGQTQPGGGGARVAEKVEGVERRFAARLAHRIQRGADEQVVLDAGDVRRRLEGQEQAGAGALLHIHRQQIVARETRLPADHAVARVAGQRQAQRALSAAVGAHQHQQFTGPHLQRCRSEHMVFGHIDPQVAQFQQAFCGVHGLSFIAFNPPRLPATPPARPWLRARIPSAALRAPPGRSRRRSVR